jgi:hypothetical protein
MSQATIFGYERQLFDHGLRDENAVKRVFMDFREVREGADMIDTDGECRNTGLDYVSLFRPTRPADPQPERLSSVSSKRAPISLRRWPSPPLAKGRSVRRRSVDPDRPEPKRASGCRSGPSPALDPIFGFLAGHGLPPCIPRSYEWLVACDPQRQAMLSDRNQFGDRFAVAGNDDRLTLFYELQEARELGFSLVNIDLHASNASSFS